MECPICCEKYNKTTRKQITCICEKECCRGCMKKYIESKAEDLHCMFCKVKWNRDFLYANFDKTYVQKDYKTYRENILFEKEIGMLPATQPFVEKELKIEELQEEAKILNTERELASRTYFAKLREIDVLRNTTSVERKKYVHKCPSNTCHGYLSTQLKCELCGIWVCSDCREIKGNTRDTPHTCNPEILETVKLINNDSKPCPSCSSVIYKIEGCNQMFCTECHVAFDWNTLRIQTGLIHNPHFFEWQRRVNNNEHVPRNPNDVLCGRELDNRMFSMLKQKIGQQYTNSHLMTKDTFNEKIMNVVKENCNSYKLHSRIVADFKRLSSPNLNPFEYATRCYQSIFNIYRDFQKDMSSDEIEAIFENELPIVEFTKKINKLSNIIRHTIHIREVEMNRWNNLDRLNNNLDLRVAYMRNKMTEDFFKFNIQKRDKESQRNTECGNVLRMYVSCLTDLLHRLNDDVENFDEILAEMHELRKYTNEILLRILSVYGSSMKHCINENFSYEIQRTYGSGSSSSSGGGNSTPSPVPSGSPTLAPTIV